MIPSVTIFGVKTHYMTCFKSTNRTDLIYGQSGYIHWHST